MPSTFTPDQLLLLQTVAEHSQGMGVKLYLVGGFVRDLLLGSDLSDLDLDILVEGDTSLSSESSVAAFFARSFANKMRAECKEFEKFMTAKVILSETSPLATSITELDFASARTERYARPGALPTVHPANLDDDLRRRDFTCNAMALPLDRLVAREPAEDLVIDQFGGIRDLQSRIIRTLHDQSFIDDPTRAFRACRYLARLDGKLEEKTAQQLRSMIQSDGLDTISRFRVLSELRHIFAEDRAVIAVNYLHSLGILSAIQLVPEANIREFLDYFAVIWRPLSSKAGNSNGTNLDRRFEIGMATVRRAAGDNYATEWKDLPLSRVQRRSIEHLAELEVQDLQNELANTVDTNRAE